MPAEKWQISGGLYREPRGGTGLTKALHWVLPQHWQRAWRDNGVFRSIADGVAVAMGATMCIANPKLALRFAKLKQFRSIHPYGPYPSQVVEIVAHSSSCPRGVGRRKSSVTGADKMLYGIPAGSTGQALSDKLFVFVHGGAWGSGIPLFYVLLAESLIEAGFAVLLLGYRVYPDGDTTDQVHDVERGLRWIHTNRRRVGLKADGRVYLAGHSSGAHISALYLLGRAAKPQRHRFDPKVSGFIGLSGVYDIRKHYIYESRRGVHEISPMKASNGGVYRQLLEYSPSEVLHSRFNRHTASHLPPSLIIHGTRDETVPVSSSVEFAAELASLGVPVVVRFLPEKNHFDTVGQLMLGTGSETERAIVEFCDAHHAPSSAVAGSFTSRL
ncbi:unnamed protein product [Chrysoparadoxa australica]